jgi:hypothetical protein
MLTMEQQMLLQQQRYWTNQYQLTPTMYLLSMMRHSLLYSDVLKIQNSSSYYYHCSHYCL